jgi:hypothetical protein
MLLGKDTLLAFVFVGVGGVVIAAVVPKLGGPALRDAVEATRREGA